MTYKNKNIELTKNELKILIFLVRNKGVIVSREELMEHLWNDDFFVDNSTLSVNVTRLRKKLAEIALELGSDVPYCLMRGTALAEGRGEILTKIAPCPKAWIVLAKPPVGLSTPAVYKAIDSLNIEYHPDTDGIIKAIKNNDIYEISSKLSNVLEEASIPMCPMIGQIKEKLLLSGAIGSLMSGSGPTVYGIFDDIKKAENAINVIKDEFKIRDVILTKIFNA